MNSGKAYDGLSRSDAVVALWHVRGDTFHVKVQTHDLVHRELDTLS